MSKHIVRACERTRRKKGQPAGDLFLGDVRGTAYSAHGRAKIHFLTTAVSSAAVLIRKRSQHSKWKTKHRDYLSPVRHARIYPSRYINTTYGIRIAHPPARCPVSGRFNLYPPAQMYWRRDRLENVPKDRANCVQAKSELIPKIVGRTCQQKTPIIPNNTTRLLTK